MIDGGHEMKSKALQEFVNIIFNDEKTRQQFESNPDSVLSRFNLTEQEKRAIMKTHTELGLVTSNSPQLEAAIDPTYQWLAPTP
jgi:hypothetical protein